jgi:hypothetical protein
VKSAEALGESTVVLLEILKVALDPFEVLTGFVDDFENYSQAIRIGPLTSK